MDRFLYRIGMLANFAGSQGRWKPIYKRGRSGEYDQSGQVEFEAKSHYATCFKNVFVVRGARSAHLLILALMYFVSVTRPKLESLDLSQNQLESVTGLSTLPALVLLNLGKIAVNLLCDVT